MATIHRLPGSGRRPAKPHAMPNPMSPAEVERLLMLAARDRFGLEQVLHAIRVVRGWHETTGRLRKDWPMVVVNGMRTGWALRGFKEAWDRGVYRTKGAGLVRGQAETYTPLVRENIATLVERQRAIWEDPDVGQSSGEA